MIDVFDANGAMPGVLLVPVITADEDATTALLATSCFGAVMIIILAAAIRRSHVRRNAS